MSGTAARGSTTGMYPLKSLLGYLVPYRWHVAAGTLCLLLAIPCSLFHPLAWRFIVDEVVLNKRYTLLLPALGVMYGVHLLGTLFGMARTWFLGRAGEYFIFDVRNAVYAKLQTQGLSYFHKRRSGDIVARVMGDVEAVQSAVVGGIDEIFSSLVSFAFVAGIIIYLHWVVGLITLIPLVFVGGLIFTFNRRVKELYRRVRDKLGDVTAKLQETLAGIAIIKGFSREAFELDRFRQTGQGYLDASLLGVKVRALYMPSVMAVGFLSNVLMIGLGGWFVIQGSFTLGGLVAYRGYWWQLFSPVTSIARINEVWQRANAAASRIVEILEEPQVITDQPEALMVDRARGAITLSHVSFAYDTGVQSIEDVSLEIAAGQSLGVVGPSGAGKSTLLALLLRFYDPTGGQIRLDGTDLRQITQRSLRRQFAIVGQDAFLFNENLRDNIRYGKLDATDLQIEQAAKLANAHDFICALPRGYASLVGERGVKLSGGQRQRICIARAFLANPAVLLLDEATAAVEPESELAIQAALERLMRDRTTIIVSHRLSMVRDTDTIAVIERGRLTERGSHAELMQAGGWYARMYRLQMGEPAREHGPESSEQTRGRSQESLDS